MGIDLARYPSSDPMFTVVLLLAHFGIDCVVDVGANSGGFASTIRSLGYSGRIVSLEPLSGPFELLAARAAKDPDWEVLRVAAGDADCEIEINVAGNAGHSSSVLAMLDTHADAAPESRYVGTEIVPQRRLDGLLPKFGIGSAQPAFLKLDVQGYEAAVLDGAVELFGAAAIKGLQMELSLVPLYAGAITYAEGLDRAERLGMSLMGLVPGFSDPHSGRLLQADAVFFAEPSTYVAS
ncbi:FkbM family methyltransferase [Mycobacterium sp. OAE908]|uniref:FkbM family methyltransferase n=1 Tax=Mycobacterium sp. OAE908 TaxID=2817899 RepID=UPI001AE3A385